jgi:hypothetical protein
MKYAALILAYNESTLLKACLKQFPPWVEKILVLVSQSPWKGFRVPGAGVSVDVCKAQTDPRIEWVTLNWRTEQEQRNWGLGRLYGFDWVLILDADEYYTQSDWGKIRRLDNESDTVAITKTMKTYWKTPEWEFYPEDSHKPVVAIRPNKATFFDKRDAPHDHPRIELPIVLHHFSWVRTDEEVKQKIQNWMHADDFDGDAWYKTKWKDWNENVKNIHPYKEGIEAKRTECPKDILDLF